MSKLRPILFSTAMVQAILDGRKTQTRRVCRHQHWSYSELVDVNVNGITQKVDRSVSCPYGQPGDILWVRETWAPLGEYPNNTFMYKTDVGKPYSKWKPSIHMPFAAARIFLRVKSVRVERLQDISEADAVAEGVKRVRDACYVVEGFDYDLVGLCHNSPVTAFAKLWAHINGPESWDANPWVWVVEFERISREEALK